METFQLFQLTVSIVTIAASGFGAYMGVKIAITKLEGDIEKIEVQISGLDSRLTRVEDKVFE
ncbi:MAG TPA: hypothetical protein DCX45_03535 [Acinetobacter junii]|nr:hypothetical protein [Acinetobacter junii]